MQWSLIFMALCFLCGKLSFYFLSVHFTGTAIVCHRQVDLPERVMGEQPFGPLTLLKDVTFLLLNLLHVLHDFLLALALALALALQSTCQPVT